MSGEHASIIIPLEDKYREISDIPGYYLKWKIDPYR
jgi:hypothetical protein